jgi:hypothetical protein
MMHIRFAWLTLLVFTIITGGCTTTGGKTRSLEQQASPSAASESYYEKLLLARQMLQADKLPEAKRHFEAALAQPGLEQVDAGAAYHGLLYVGYLQAINARELTNLLRNLDGAVGVNHQDNRVWFWQGVLIGEHPFDRPTAMRLFGYAPFRTDFEQLIREKRYREALSRFPLDLEGANIVQETTRDMLAEVVFPGQQELLCKATLERYPNSITYTMMVCRFLLGDASVSLKAIEEQLRSESPQRLFWLSLLREVELSRNATYEDSKSH